MEPPTDSPTYGLELFDFPVPPELVIRVDDVESELLQKFTSPLLAIIFEYTKPFLLLVRAFRQPDNLRHERDGFEVAAGPWLYIAQDFVVPANVWESLGVVFSTCKWRDRDRFEECSVLSYHPDESRLANISLRYQDVHYRSLRGFIYAAQQVVRDYLPAPHQI